jgi:hypothetical protein
MKRTALLLGGVVGVATLTLTVGLGAAAPAKREVALRTPLPGKIAVAVVRFRVPARRPAPKLRLARAYAGTSTAAAVLGTARLPGTRRAYVGVVAIVNFRPSGAALQAAVRPILRAAATRTFTVDFAGDAEAYRGRLARQLRRIGLRSWRTHALRLPPVAANPGYRNARRLLDQVRRVLVRRPDPSFLAAVRGNVTPPPPVVPPPPPPAGPPPLVPLSSDPFTNPASQHRAQVEPDSFAFGSTLVTAFQSGRFYDGGASGIGFATSTNGGASWTKGFLPNLTKDLDNGPYDRATDPSVAYDSRRGVWLIETLALNDTAGGGIAGVAVVVSRSTDGLSWSAPVTVGTGGDPDKNWLVCDNHPSSPYYGNCYSEWDDVADGDRIKMTRSTNGGLNWSPPINTADNATGIGGQPVVQPNGSVIVPIGNDDLSAILSFRSTDGGASWSTATVVDSVSERDVAGGLRAGPLPSAEVDAAGNVYVVWDDCRFRPPCAANDIVMSTTTQAGYPLWSPVTRIPIDAVTSGADHFIPGLGVDPTTAGASARLALAYYFYPSADCAADTCELDVGFISSADGGASWSPGAQIAGPMALSWLPDTNQGRMVGDYISTSFSAGTAHPFFAFAKAPSDAAFDQAIYTR